MSDRHPVRDPPRIYLRTKQRDGGNKVVFLLAIKNIALIQGHKFKKEIPRIAYIDMLNGIIPGHALKISWESDQIEGPLSKRYSAASITNQILNRKGDWESTEELEFQTSKQNKQKQKLKELKSRAQKALNLVEIIGLDLQLLKLKYPNSTESFSIDFSTTNPLNPQPEHGSVASPKSKYE